MTRTTNGSSARIALSVSPPYCIRGQIWDGDDLLQILQKSPYETDAVHARRQTVLITCALEHSMSVDLHDIKHALVCLIPALHGCFGNLKLQLHCLHEVARIVQDRMVRDHWQLPEQIRWLTELVIRTLHDKNILHAASYVALKLKRPDVHIWDPKRTTTGMTWVSTILGEAVHNTPRVYGT